MLYTVKTFLLLSWSPIVGALLSLSFYWTHI